MLVIRLASAVDGPAEGTGVKDCIGSTNHQLGLSRGHLHGQSNPPNPKTVLDT